MAREKTSEGEYVSFRARPMEGYSDAITRAIVNLSEKSMEKGEYGGIGPGYEDGVDDFIANVPSIEKRTRKVDIALLDEIRYAYDDLNEIANDGGDGDKIDPPLDLPPMKNATYLDVFRWIARLDTGRFGIRKDDPLYRAMRLAKSILKKQATIDLLDDMGALRHRARESSMQEGEDDDLFKDYTPAE